MTFHIPARLICACIVFIPPIFLSRRFPEFRGSASWRLYLSQALIWNGGLGIFVAPALFLGVFSGPWGVLFAVVIGWTIAVGLGWAGQHLENSLRAGTRSPARRT